MIKEELKKIPLEKCLIKNLYRLITPSKINSEGHINFWNERDIFDLLKKAKLKVIKYKIINPPKDLQFSNKCDSELIKPLSFFVRLFRKFTFSYQPVYSFLFGSNIFVLCISSVKPPDCDAENLSLTERLIYLIILV